MQELLIGLVPHSLGKNFPPNNPNDDSRGLGVAAVIAVILALSVLFLTSLIGYFWVRQTALVKGTWISIGVSRIPIMLYFSTGSLFMSSIMFHRSIQFYRNENFKKFKRLIIITFFLAICFLLFQTASWREMVIQNLTPRTPNLFSFMFYFLTSLHVLHVFAGFIPLARITYRSHQIERNANYENSLVVTSIYWHFLDIVWIILFCVLYFY